MEDEPTYLQELENVLKDLDFFVEFLQLRGVQVSPLRHRREVLAELD